MLGLARRESLYGYAFVAPWVVGFVAFILGPLVASMYLSLTEYNVLAPPAWVGLANFQRALTVDPVFWVSLRVTLLFTVIVVPLGLAASLACAILLNQRLRGQVFFRALFYMPSLVPAVSTALLFAWLLNPDFGAVNAWLRAIGILNAPKWLASTTWALPSIILISLWAGAGGGRMIIFLAGLQSVPFELQEAAEIDGANRLQRFWHVSVPMISPTLFFNLIIGFIGAFQVFAVAFIATNGGPGDATRFYTLYLYENAFRYFNIGYGSALAWIMFVLLLVVTLVQFALARRWVYYEGAREGMIW